MIDYISWVYPSLTNSGKTHRRPLIKNLQMIMKNWLPRPVATKTPKLRTQNLKPGRPMALFLGRSLFSQGNFLDQSHRRGWRVFAPRGPEDAVNARCDQLVNVQLNANSVGRRTKWTCSIGWLFTSLKTTSWFRVPENDGTMLCYAGFENLFWKQPAGVSNSISNIKLPALESLSNETQIKHRNTPP